MTEPKKRTGPKPKDEPKDEPPKLGRPFKDAGRIRATWYIEEPLHRAIEAEAKRRGVSRSDVLNELLTASRIAR